MADNPNSHRRSARLIPSTRLSTGKPSDQQSFDQTGCVVLNTGLVSELAAIRKTCIEVFSLAAVHNGLASITDDAGVCKLREPETKVYQVVSL